jgi:hypothetical protein
VINCLLQASEVYIFNFLIKRLETDAHIIASEIYIDFYHLKIKWIINRNERENNDIPDAAMSQNRLTWCTWDLGPSHLMLNQESDS